MRALFIVLLLSVYTYGRDTFQNTVIEICDNNKCENRTITGRLTSRTLNSMEVTRIKIKSSFKSLQENSVVSLPKLKVLDISQLNVEYLRPGCMVNLPSVVEFHGWNNKIRNIEFKVFSNMSYEKIYLNRNNISYIDESAFSNMPYLEILNLEQNKIDTIYTFQEITGVTSLNLAKNQIEVVKANTFDKISELAYLDLSYNEIRTIEDNAFAGLQHLEVLNLEWNHLEILHNTAFDYNTRIGVLYLGMNNLTLLHDGFFDWIKIEKVALEPNPWSCPCFKKFTEDAYEKNVIIISRYEYSSLLCDDSLPVCVAPENNYTVCTDFSLRNSKNLQDYHKVMKSQIEFNLMLVYRKNQI